MWPSSGPTSNASATSCGSWTRTACDGLAPQPADYLMCVSAAVTRLRACRSASRAREVLTSSRP
jgi:hypothetical protein